MIKPDPSTRPAMECRLFSSDLDGTLVGKTDATLSFADTWQRLQQDGQAPILCYNTGRLLEDTRRVVRRSGLIESDYMICGVGTLIYDNREQQVLPDFNALLKDHWDRTLVDEIVPRLIRNIQPQPPHQQTEFKSSWFANNLDPEPLDELREALADAGLNASVVYSSSRDLDVLPRLANKGNALTWLLRHLGEKPQHCIVAGDTANDSDMFRVKDLRGRILPDNAQPELLQSLIGMEFYHARGHSAEGILEGLQHYGVIDKISQCPPGSPRHASIEPELRRLFQDDVGSDQLPSAAGQRSEQEPQTTADPDMSTNEDRLATAPVLCFGEVLWDVLPDGPHLGGAPLNVAWHIARHGLGAAVVSAVGDDDLGRRAVREIAAGGVDTSLIRVLPDAPTGTVEVSLDDDGDASYHFPDDVAWDHIPVSGETAAAAAKARALVYGSLAMRGRANRETLHALLDQLPPSCLVVMDVNLRPPFRQREPILDLARRASVLKLNLSELEFLLDRRLDRPASGGGTGPGLEALAELHQITGCQACCLTLGENGAMWWRHGHPPASFRHSGHVGRYPLANTIGAGDSFLASLVGTLLRTGEVDEAALDRAGLVAAFVTSSPSATPDYDPDQLPPPENPLLSP